VKSTFTRIGLILISFGVPFLLVMTSIRLLITPLYPQIEYRMPYFPVDLYGFSFEDRLKWSRPSIEYLVNNADLSYLADLRLPDGSSLYNERELSHMLDVKVLVQRMIVVWIGLVVVYAGLSLWAWRGKWMSQLWGALAAGGRWTITLILCLLALVAVSFNWLFTMFHRLFFSGDTWIFLYSDSLIRLFPIPFWRDAFIFVGAFTIGVAVLLIIYGGRWSQDDSQPQTE
jgi:integral membrane protein (TIGR01906 family)